MENRRTMTTSLWLMFLWIPVIYSHTFDDEKRLRNKLFESYNSDIRPPFDHTTTLNVSVLYFIRSVHDLDDVSRIFTVSGAFQSQWTDKRLVWNTSEFSNIQTIVVSYKDIWVPELRVYNAADEMHLDSAHSSVHINSNGSLFWLQGTTIKATYEPDMTYFPYDTQTCKLQVYSTRYWRHEVFTFNALNTMDASLFAQNNEWDLVETFSAVYFSNISTTTRLEFSVTLERKSLYYTLCIVVPIATLTLVNPLVFLLPCESGERVTFSVTMLLSFGIFFVQVKDHTPELSYPMPHLSYFVFSTYIGSALATVLIIVLNHFHHKDNSHPVPFFLYYVVRILSFRIFLDLCKSFRRKKIKIEDITDSRNVNTNTQRCDINCSWQSISRSLDMIFFTYAYIVMLAFLIYRIFR